MKIKKIAALCSREGVFSLKDKTDNEGVVTQWLGDGRAYYPLLGAPMLDQDGLCTMFDITGKKRESTIVTHDEMSEKTNVDDLNDGDIRLEPEGLSIFYHGTTILPLRGANGIILIQEKYLEPLDDEKKLLALYSRTAGGQTYVAIKAGMMLRGIVAQYQVTEGLAEKLEIIALACKDDLERQRQEQENDQQSMYENAGKNTDESEG